jgi:prevent-host-death family protein
MKTITAANANRHFSEMLREARQGEVFLIISRGKPVATIGPVPPPVVGGVAAKEALLARLQAQKSTDNRTWTRNELYDETTV